MLQLIVIVDGNAFGLFESREQLDVWLKTHYPIAFSQKTYRYASLGCKCDMYNGGNCIYCQMNTVD